MLPAFLFIFAKIKPALVSAARYLFMKRKQRNCNELSNFGTEPFSYTS